jgi:hypothetical protein
MGGRRRGGLDVLEQGLVSGVLRGGNGEDMPTWPTMLKPTGISSWESSGRMARIISTAWRQCAWSRF